MKNLRIYLNRACIVVLLIGLPFCQLNAQTETELTKEEKKEIKVESKRVKDSLNAKKNVHFLGFPVLNYNRSVGFMFGALGMMTYRYNKEDLISPQSRFGLFAMVSTNKTFGFSFFQENYFKEDKWRLNWYLGYFSFNFQFHVDIPILPNGLFIDYKTNQYFGNIKGLRKIVDKFYLGIHMNMSYLRTTYLDTLSTEAKWLNSFGLSMQYDSRDNQNYPTKGWNIEYDDDHYIKGLGNENYYYGLSIIANNYASINDKMLFATRFKTKLGFGDVPFEAQTFVGGTDIRGYSDGKHRGNQLYALQTEFRYMFVERWGLVAFGGIATAFDKAKELNWDLLLPGVGAGFRFKMIKSQNINVGIEAAVGKESWGIYFRIREAF